MKISIRTSANKEENINKAREQAQDNPKIKSVIIGYADITFDDKYKLNGAQIRERLDEEKKVYVQLPFYLQDPEKNNGVARQEILHPVNSQTRNALNNAVLDQFKSGTKDTLEYDLGDKVTFKPTVTTEMVEVFSNSKFDNVGKARIGFGDWMLHGVNIKPYSSDNPEHKTGLHINLAASPKPAVDENKQPIYNADGTRKMDYQTIFMPLTTEAYEELNSTVLAAYETAKKEMAKNASWGIGVPKPRTEENKSVKKDNVQDANVDYSDMDLSEFEDLDLTASNGISR